MARDNSAAFNELQLWIDQANSLGVLPTEIAKEVAPTLDQKIRQNISAGVDPEGKPWQLTKEGKRPLTNAGAALTVRAISSVVQAKLTGHVALHHLGAAKGAPKRQILPSSKLPQPMTAAIRQVAVERFDKHMKGR
jgi:phage gpG-like protein